ncbi:hypothetical protein KBD33_05330 [Candidatus Gracilibacteria bacterium]|nr:hypothetical protein [Candidatus Gracilibacteria bacterium]
MTSTGLTEFDILRSIEICIKDHVHFVIPKFLIKNTAVLILQSATAQIALSKIDVYLKEVHKENIIKNKSLFLDIKNIFLDYKMVLAFWEGKIKINYEKIFKEKEALLGEDRNDKYELSNSGKRSLENIQKQGICIKINIEMLKSKGNKIQSPGVSLLGYYGDCRALQINNFSNSKISHLIHDLFDHTYFFLECREIFASSSAFRHKVGNPEKRDIFSRESELLASIAYERRHYLQNMQNFQLSLRNDFIISIVKKSFGRLADKYIGKINDLDERGISIYHIYYNVICELYEQIRKVGPIKLINKKGELEGDITMMIGNDYLKVCIDVLYFIMQNENIFKDTLSSIYSYVESLIEDCLNSNLTEYTTTIDVNILKNTLE